MNAISTKKKTALAMGILFAVFALLGACESQGGGSTATASVITLDSPTMSPQCKADTGQQDAIAVNASMLHESIAPQQQPASCQGVPQAVWDAFVKADTAAMVRALR